MDHIPIGMFIGDDSRRALYVMSCDHTLGQHQIAQLRAEMAKANAAVPEDPLRFLVLGPGIKLHKLYVAAPNDGLVPGAEFCAA